MGAKSLMEVTVNSKDKIIEVLQGWASENRWYAFHYLADEADVPEKECRQIVKELEKKGIVGKIWLYNEHTGKLAGSGYILDELKASDLFY